MNRHIRPMILIGTFALTVFAQYATGRYIAHDIVHELYPGYSTEIPTMLNSQYFWLFIGIVALAGLLWLLVFEEDSPEEASWGHVAEDKFIGAMLCLAASLALCTTAFLAAHKYTDIAGWGVIIFDGVFGICVAIRVWSFLNEGPADIRDVIRDAHLQSKENR